MFIPLKTQKDEKISVNVNKILFFAENKKGYSSIILEDGSQIDLNETYDELLRRFTQCR